MWRMSVNVPAWSTPHLISVLLKTLYEIPIRHYISTFQMFSSFLFRINDLKLIYKQVQFWTNGITWGYQEWNFRTEINKSIKCPTTCCDHKNRIRWWVFIDWHIVSGKDNVRTLITWQSRNTILPEIMGTQIDSFPWKPPKINTTENTTTNWDLKKKLTTKNILSQIFWLWNLNRLEKEH